MGVPLFWFQTDYGKRTKYFGKKELNLVPNAGKPTKIRVVPVSLLEFFDKTKAIPTPVQENFKKRFRPRSQCPSLRTKGIRAVAGKKTKCSKFPGKASFMVKRR